MEGPVGQKAQAEIWPKQSSRSRIRIYIQMKPDERIQAKYKIKGRIQTLPAWNMTHQVLEQSIAYLLH